MAVSKQPSSTAVTIGFPSGTTITGLIRETYETSSERDIEDVRNEDNDVYAQVLSNSVSIIKVTGHTETSATIPSKGDTVTIDSDKYLVHDISASYSRTICRFSMELRKPSELTYT
jgi:pyruvoyl-dependent arginine decarboxylase (PvlArgDC)